MMDVDYPENNKDSSLINNKGNTPSTTREGEDNPDRPAHVDRYSVKGERRPEKKDGQLLPEGFSQSASDVDVLQIPLQDPRSRIRAEYDNADLHPYQRLHREGEKDITRRHTTTHTETLTPTATPTTSGPGFAYGSSTSTSTCAPAACNSERGNVNIELHGDGADSPDLGLSLSAAECKYIDRPVDNGLGGQMRLSIQELLVEPPSFPTSSSHIHNRNVVGSRNRSGKGSPISVYSTPSPIWPQSPTPTSAVPVPIGGYTCSPHSSPRPLYQQEAGTGSYPYHQQSPGHHSQSHSPIPFPSPRRDRERERERERERPGPITLRSFTSSSLRSSFTRALASPYARPSSSQSLTPGIRNEMPVHPATSPVITSALRMDSSAQEQDAGQFNHDLRSAYGSGADTGAGVGVGLGITFPGGSGRGSGSMSTQGRRKAPDWPSPKKKESRSYSFNTHFQPSASASAQTPREWYVKIPTVLRVPPMAGIQPSQSHLQSPAFPGIRYHYDGPSTPVSITGMGQQQGGSKRPGPGDGPVSASAPVRRVHLTDVPKTQVIKALNNKASEYWYTPETSDCRICKSNFIPHCRCAVTSFSSDCHDRCPDPKKEITWSQ